MLVGQGFFRYILGMRMVLAVFLLIFSFSTTVFATIIDTPDFGVVEKTADGLAKKVGDKSVLLVFDIDNTLLTMDSDLGSDQWFTWQSEMLKPDDKMRVAPTFAGILKVQGVLFGLGSMSPPGGSEQVALAKKLAERFPAIVLTSRSCFYDPGKSYSFVDSTYRELRRNGYDFAASAIGPFGGYASPFVAYAPKDIAALKLTEDQKDALGTAKPPRRACFNSGVFMTAGQHKGLMLRLLLKRTGADKKIKAIVAVDDKLKLCKQYEEAFAPKMDAHCVRYGATDKRVASFFESDKKAVVEGWSDIEKTAKKYYPFDWE